MSDPALAPIVPMKGVIGDLPAAGDGWMTEFKWDGMRTLVHVGTDRMAVRTGSARDVTVGFPELADFAEEVPIGSVVDGELVVMRDGRPSFRALQNRIHQRRPNQSLVDAFPVQFVAFDVLRFDGLDITGLPFEDRRRVLVDTITPSGRWLVSNASDGPPADLFGVAERFGMEGVMCKRPDSPYLPGTRSPAWRKVKVRPRRDMVVGGWIGGSGAFSETIGSLVVGVADEGSFRCAGAVGSGLRDVDRAWLLRNLRSTSTCPFTNPEILDGRPRSRSAIHWVEPEVVVEVGFARWDPGEPLWQPTFHGLRFDATPADTATDIAR